jgi:hypothetical protein
MSRNTYGKAITRISGSLTIKQGDKEQEVSFTCDRPNTLEAAIKLVGERAALRILQDYLWDKTRCEARATAKSTPVKHIEFIS